MGKPEAHVEDYLRDRVKALGGSVRKVQWVGRRGAPDQFVMLPRYQWHGFVECKRSGPDGNATVQQLNEILLLKASGINAHLISSREQVDALLEGVTRL